MPPRRPIFWECATRLATALLALSCPFITPALARAQQGAGTIAGRVTTAAAHAPLVAAHVSVDGTDLGASTDSAGRYRITGVPAGHRVVVAQRVGRQPGRQAVVVHAGQTVQADFALRPASLLLPGVTVTATRSAEPTAQVAATVNVMPRQQVDASPARATDDLLRQMPGVELPRASSTVSGAEEIVSIRGSGEGRTLVLLDGVPLNDPWGEWIQWNRAPRFQLDRVEVLEGGGSSLYGNYAMGGVISLTSRPIRHRALDAMLSTGSRGEADVSLFGSNVSGRLGYSLSGDYGTGGGYTVIAPDQRGPIDQRSEVTRRNLTGRAEYALGPSNTLTATASYFDDDRRLGTPLSEPDRRHITSGALGGDFGDVLGGRVQARLYGQVQRYETRASAVNATRTAELPLVAQRIPNHDLGGSVQWSRPAGIFQTLSVGGDFRYMEGRLDEVVYDSSGNVAGTRSAGGAQQVGGVFVQGVLAPATRLRIEASARVDGWRSYAGSRADSAVTPPTATRYAARTNAAFAPRLGVRYRLTSSLTVRSSVYQAFRAPTLSEEYRTFYSGPNTFMGNPSLTPEYLTGYDAGVDWQPAPAFELRATAFWNGYRDLDDFVFKSTGASGGAVLQRENLGRARSMGVEGELAWRLNPVLTLGASYDYDDARVSSTGQLVNRIPLQRGSVRATYRSGKVGAVNLIYRYEGPNHALGGMRLAPFGVVDADAQRLLFDHTSAFVSVENVFDAQYAVNYAGPLESIGLPRTIRGGFTVRAF